MNFYLAVVLLWLVIVPVVVASCVGLWALCARGWREHKLDKLWSDKFGAGGGPASWASSGLTETPAPDIFPREWTLARARPYDQDNDAA